MFHSALEPEIEPDEIEHVYAKETFALIGAQSGAVVYNTALAAMIAPDTESPIEVLFGVAAVKFFNEKYKNVPTMKFVRCQKIAEHSFRGDHTLLMHQYQWRNYRIDWVIKITFLKQPYFFIECDGRDFHSSEEQILRDRKKDEAARSAGIPIFRFTGSQLERNANACVNFVYGEIKSQYRREWNAGYHRAA